MLPDFYVNILNSPYCLAWKGLFMMLISLASCEISPQQLGSIYQITKANILPMEFHLRGKKKLENLCKLYMQKNANVY